MECLRRVMIATACLAALAPPASGQSPDASGKWEVTFTTEQGPTAATMTLTKDGEKLRGTIVSTRGEVAIEGTQKAAIVNLFLTVQTENGAIDVAMAGTQTGDTISGTAQYGSSGQGEWIAKRAAAPAPANLTGAWLFDVVTPAGTGTPTITLKQDGEKLTGQYSGQLGEAPVSGTIKDNTFTFRFDVSVEGTTLTIVYNGTVDKDAVKGTVRLGDMGEGTFTGKRKP